MAKKKAKKTKKPFNNEAFLENLREGCARDEESIRKMFQDGKTLPENTTGPKSIRDLFNPSSPLVLLGATINYCISNPHTLGSARNYR